MFRDVVGPYGQNETDSKTVTTNGTPYVVPAFPASPLEHCLFQIEKAVSVSSN